MLLQPTVMLPTAEEAVIRGSSLLLTSLVAVPPQYLGIPLKPIRHYAAQSAPRQTLANVNGEDRLPLAMADVTMAKLG